MKIEEVKKTKPKKSQINIRINQLDKDWLKIMGISPTKVFNKSIKELKKEK